MTDLAESLAQRGVDVTALAGRGRYNGGERLPRSEEYKGVRIVRAWATGFGKRNIVGRIADYLSFYIGASWRMLTLSRHDIVMALTTPPLIGLVALLIGRLRGMRIVMLVQDVYPDVAVALGALSEKSGVTRLLDWANRQTLNRADRIVVLGESMRDRIALKLADGNSRVDVIHNWADGSEIYPIDTTDNPFSVRHDLSNSFVVLFSGNLGRVNEFTTVLEAACVLSKRRDIKFLFIGEGARASEIREFAEHHSLNNVVILPYQPRNMLRYSLAAGDALLVTLADGLAGLSVPSKAYAIMAAGRPMLFVGDPQSEVARIIEERSCGAAVASGESSELAEIIASWAAERSKPRELGIAARAAFEESFDRARAVNAYVETFQKCLEFPPTKLQSSGDAVRNTASLR